MALDGLPQIGDSDDAVVELLEIIARNTGGIPGQDIHLTEGGLEVHEGDVRHGDVKGRFGGDDLAYVTTGEGGMIVPETWDDLPLGMTARVVNLRFNIPIHIAFLNPEERSSWIIPLDPDENESPFTIGDSYGLNADEIWFRIDPLIDPDDYLDEGEDPVVHIIAYR